MSNATNRVEGIQPIDESVIAAGAATPDALLEPTTTVRLNQALSQAFGDVAQSGPSDQLRGYANEAVGRTKLAVGLALRSPELALAGIAQGALGAVQRYVGEAKMAADAEHSTGMRADEKDIVAP